MGFYKIRPAKQPETFSETRYCSQTGGSIYSHNVTSLRRVNIIVLVYAMFLPYGAAPTTPLYTPIPLPLLPANCKCPALVRYFLAYCEGSSCIRTPSPPFDDGRLCIYRRDLSGILGYRLHVESCRCRMGSKILPNRLDKVRPGSMRQYHKTLLI